MAGVAGETLTISIPFPALLLGTAATLLGAWELAVVRTASLFYFLDVAYLVLAMSLLGLALGALWARTRANRFPLRVVFALLLGSPPIIWWLLARYDVAWATLLFVLPFVFFGAASTMVWQQMSALESRVRVYAAELIGAVFGLAVLGPFAVSVLPLDVLGGVGINTHLRELVAREGLRNQQFVTSAFARTDLVHTNRTSVAYIFTDAMFVTRAVQWDGVSPRFDDPVVEDLARMKRFALLSGPRESVLLLGAGAGFDMAIALQEQAAQVDAVEVNPQTIAYAKDLDAWAGNVLADGRVQVHIAEGRRFVMTSTQTWDHISLTLMQTSPATLRGRSHVDGRVLTVEALRSYLAHLNPFGVVAIIQNSRALADRTWAALQVASGGDTTRLLRFELINNSAGDNPFSHLLLARNEPFSSVEVLGLKNIGRDFGIQAVKPSAGATLRPATDDRPFMFEPGLLIVASSLVAAAVTILVLLFLLVREKRHARTVGTAALAGMVGMALQILVLYRFQTALGHPTLAMGLALASVLGGASVGVLALGKSIEGTRMTVIAGAFALLGVLVFASAGSMVASFCASLEPALAGGFMVAFTAACCLPLGLPFLALIHEIQNKDEKQAGLVIGADGLGGVAGASLATMVSMAAGFNTTAWMLVASLVIFCVLVTRRHNPLASIQ